MKPERVLEFWFEEIDSKLWFKKDEEFDHQVRELFFETYQNTLYGKNSDWREDAQGRLAEIIVLDQFPRNMFRDSPKSFGGDALALQLAEEAVRAGDDQKIQIGKRAFIYMPYMHSEDLKVHEIAIQLFSQAGLENNLKFEYAHKKIIDRFGRFPHRNKILARTSTAEEIEFLKQAGSSF
jgi:uncharacterized protein (DUF924 family)